MSDEREKLTGEAEGEREKIADVEAHKLQSRMAETEEKRDKIAESDEDDVEAHVLAPKLQPGKMQT